VVVGGGWQFPIRPWIGLFVDADLAILFRNESFQITNLGEVASTQRLWLELQAGLLLRFF
jgi:hypothetical protein